MVGLQIRRSHHRRFAHAGELLPRVYGIDTSYLPNGVTTWPESNAGLLTEWNLAPGRYIVFVGRLIRLKGVHTLIAAYRQLPAELRNRFPLVIVGEACDQNYVRELTGLSRGANVKFVGNQTGAKLAALYRGAALFVQPSECESMPIVVLEATGSCIPTIASDIAAHREILANEGVYFESKNILELAACLQETLGDLDGAKERAKALSERVLENYSWDKIATETKDVYLRRRRSAPRSPKRKRYKTPSLTRGCFIDRIFYS